MSKSTVISALCVAAVFAGIDMAQAQYGENDRAILSSLIGFANNVPDTESLRQRALGVFLLNDIDGEPGVSRSDLELQLSIDRANLRANHISIALRDDLDGDLKISVEEMRPRLMVQARRPLRSGNTEVRPTPEQIETILDAEIAKRLRIDLDGDRIITLDEVIAAADREFPAAARATAHHKMNPGVVADEDGDGTITEAEFLKYIDEMLALLDTNGDGKVASEERMAAQHIPLRTLATPSASRPSRPYQRPPGACTMSEAPRGSSVSVVGGYDGAGLSDVYWGPTPVATEIFDLKINENGPPIYLIASFEEATLIRVSDPSGRLKRVIYTKGSVGLIGAKGAELVKSPAACHLELWSPVSITNPEPATFYQPVIGRHVSGVIRGYSLGRVTLEANRNDLMRPLAGAVDGTSESAAAILWDHFHRFNPGGLVSVDPASVKAPSPVKRHDPLPQFAGLARLVEDGTLVVLPRTNIQHTVFEDDEGRIRLAGKTFIPGGGDDAISSGKLHYIEEREKVWVGREQLALLVTREFTYPAGLKGAHSVTFVLPEGMPPPSGDPGHSRIAQLRRSDAPPAQ